MEMSNAIPVKEEIENYLILKIEEKEEDFGNTPLHAVAGTEDEKLLKLLLNNGASATQFTKNKAEKIPLEISRNSKYMFQLILLDFLNYALKSSKFPSNEFQNELGSGYKLFCLKRQFDGNKTLLEFLSDKGMVKEREEVIQLLIKIDHFRYKDSKDRSKSERRIIKILRAGMKPSRGLNDAINSVKDKYAWNTTKIAFKCLLSVAHNILFGWFLYASDIASDVYFYSGLEEEDAKTATLIHIILPFVSSLFLFFTMLYAGMVKCDWYLPLKVPLSPFTKFHKIIIEAKSHLNNKKKGEADYDKKNTELIQELDDQKTITTISMILDASFESSFQFLFQGLYSLKTIIFAIMDLHGGSLTELVNWKNVSILLSFLSFAFTSFNIRYL